MEQTHLEMRKNEQVGFVSLVWQHEESTGLGQLQDLIPCDDNPHLQYIQ